MAFDIEENWDYLLVEYSTSLDHWQTLGSANDPNWYNSSSTANGIPGNQWTGEGEDPNSLGGDNATIHDYNYDLSTFTSENNMLFRFVFRSDQAVTENGVMIDDLVVQGVLSTSNEDFSNLVTIAPNPSDGIFNIKIPNNINASIRVYNYLGQVVKQEDRITDSSHALDMSKFSSGVYILKILSDGKTATKKILLE
jgi:hypothetical protein